MLQAGAESPMMNETNVTFIPMVATVSLVAYLSLRSTSLGGRIRDLCSEVLRADRLTWKISLVEQLLQFTERYKRINFALFMALLSVSAFAGMVGSVALVNSDWIWEFGMLPNLMLVLGALFAAFSLAVTLSETKRSRRSLFLHIATTLDEIDLDGADPVVKGTVERLHQSIRLR